MLGKVVLSSEALVTSPLASRNCTIEGGGARLESGAVPVTQVPVHETDRPTAKLTLPVGPFSDVHHG